MGVGPDLGAIQRARARVEPHIHRTPVLTSGALDSQSGTLLYFKCENFQKTGSFKVRGAVNAVLSLSDEEARRGVVAHSSGNHAAALAYAAGLRGIPAWIVMPSNSPQAKLHAVEGYGGRVTLCEPTLEARESASQALIEQTGATMIHPYNNLQVIAGQGTAALELIEEQPELDAIIAPVSGGGLLSGTGIAAKSVKPGIRVIGAEPRNADDAFRSLAAKRIEPAARAATIADGLRATLCPLTFQVLQERVDEIVLVEESAIVSAMRSVWERMKLVIEPSAAVPAAVALGLGTTRGALGLRVGVILSGGNLDLDDLPFA
jgi:threonine dehydratase